MYNICNIVINVFRKPELGPTKTEFAQNSKVSDRNSNKAEKTFGKSDETYTLHSKKFETKNFVSKKKDLEKRKLVQAASSDCVIVEETLSKKTINRLLFLQHERNRLKKRQQNRSHNYKLKEIQKTAKENLKNKTKDSLIFCKPVGIEERLKKRNASSDSPNDEVEFFSFLQIEEENGKGE